MDLGPLALAEDLLGVQGLEMGGLMLVAFGPPVAELLSPWRQQCSEWRCECRQRDQNGVLFVTFSVMLHNFYKMFFKY